MKLTKKSSLQGGNARDRRQQRRFIEIRRREASPYSRQVGFRVPLFGNWELVLGAGQRRPLAGVGVFPTHRWLRRSLLGASIMAVIVFGVLLTNSRLRAATYTWVQSAWTGGVTGTTAVHPTNQTGWTEYSAKDSNVSAGATVSLSSSTQTVTDTSDTDFTGGTQSNTAITGSGSSAAETLSLSEGASATFTQYGTIGTWYVLDTATNAVWVSNTSATLTKYAADGSSTTALATVNLSPTYDGSSSNVPITYDSALGVVWALGKTSSNLNLIKINGTTGSVMSSVAIAADANTTRAIAYDSTNDVLWVAYTWTSGQRLLKVDKSGNVLLTIAIAAAPTDMAVDPGTSSIWYVDGVHTVYKQPQSGAAATTIDVTASYGGTKHIIYESATPAVWVTSEQYSFSGYHRILTSNNSVTSRTDAGLCGGLAYDSVHDVLWIVDQASAKVYKVSRTSPGVVANYTPSNTAATAHILYDTTTRSLWFNDNAGGTKRMTFVTYASSGTFTSRIIDTTVNTSYPTLSWTASTPTGTTISLKARSSTSPTMSGAPVFSTCSALTSGQSPTTGGCVTDGHRYIQYEATLGTSNTAVTSSLLDLTISYTSYTNGTLTSSPFDAGDTSNVVAKIEWTTTGTGTVKFQLQTSADGNTWSGWLGPTGSGDYYTDNTGGQSIHTTNHDGVADRYMQYKAFLVSADGATTPSLTNVTLTYVVNAPPEFSGSPTATQNADGSVSIAYTIRDTDTSTDTGSVGLVTPSFEYSIDNGAHWSTITAGLPASATTAKAVDSVAFTTYNTTWDAKTLLDGTYASQAKVRVTVSDLQAANATAQGTSAPFALDVKDPTLGATPVAVDASFSPAHVSLSASDDSSLQMCVTLDNTQTNCQAYASSTTISLATDPDTVYVLFVDANGNTASSSAISPQTPSNLVIRDISNTATDEYQLFLTWAATSIPVGQFASYRVYGSTDGSSYSLLSTITDKTINYYLHKTLSAGSTRYYKVTSSTNTGNTSYYSTAIHGTANGQGGGTDVVAPSISNVQATSITTQSAVIQWDTDELSNSTVGYSTQAAHFDTEVGVATMADTASGVGIHAVLLTGLQPDRTYYFQVKSRDPSGNEGVDTNGGDGYFFTTVAGPTINHVTTTAIDNTSATITWTTNVAANSTIRYSTSAILASPVTMTTSALVTEHSVTLTGLTLGTKYYFEVTSGVATDPNGGVYYTFTTTADATPPVITNVSVSPLTDTQAVITWTTDERATSSVAYAIDGTPVSSPTDSALNFGHAVTLSNLSADTTYTFTVTSVDGSGNSATSASNSFTTLQTLTTADELAKLLEEARHASTDTVAPTLSSVSASTTDTSASVAWTTDEEANSFIQFGTGSNDQLVYGNWVYSTSHTIDVKALLPTTTYQFTVISADKRGNIAQSRTGTFTTSATPANELSAQLQQQLQNIQQQAQSLPGPVIGGQPKVDVTATSATVSWTTDQPANSLVAFATDAEYSPHQAYVQTVGDPDHYLTQHVVKLSNLVENSVYHYQIKSTTDVGQTSTTTDATFQTPKKTFAIDNYSVNTPDTQTAVFRWTTNDIATATVNVTPYRNNVLTVDELQTVVDETKSVVHQISLSGLEPGTRYNIELVSVNTDGNRATKTISTFSTSGGGQPPIISQIHIDSALSPGQKVKVQTIISWMTDIPSTSQVFYRAGVGQAGTELPNASTLDSSFTKRHVVVITAFDPGSVYQLRVESKNSTGQIATSKALTTLTPQQEQTVFQVITNTFTQVFGWTQIFNR